MGFSEGDLSDSEGPRNVATSELFPAFNIPNTATIGQAGADTID
jgi:hypothetical protein